MCLRRFFLTIVVLTLPTSLIVQAETISWVSWTPSSAPGTTSTGSRSSLAAAANWTVRTNIEFRNRTINLTGPGWPFTNQDVVHMWLSQAGSVPYVNATIDFTNAGGLAAGGAIGFVDIDNAATSFSITAQLFDGSNYTPQSVDWTFATFKNNQADGAERVNDFETTAKRI